MANQMWMGTTSHMQFVPCPAVSSTVTRKRRVERMQFNNGGGDVSRSSAYQMEYAFNINGLAHELEGVDAFNKFASGFYGDGLIYLSHPAAYETNLFSAAWASPGLIEQGWPTIYATPTAYGTTASNSYNQPPRYATFNITGSANAVPTKTFKIAIPSTHVLNIGATVAATGTAVVAVRAWQHDGTSSISNLTGIAYDSSTRMNATFSGATYKYVEVYLTRTSTATSTISVYSMMARLYKIGVTPTLTGNHYQGEGSTGLMFADDAIVENYSYMYPPRKGISTVLAEVEAWR